MTRTTGMILALLLSAALPAAVSAQPKPEDAKKAAPARPAARPAPHPAPAARPAPAPHPVVRAPAPHPVMRAAPRPAPHMAPHPVVRAAPHAAPHIAPRQAARPGPRPAPSAAGAIRREERRAQRRQTTPRATAKPRNATAPRNAAAPQPATTRAAQRQERALRRQEDRSLRRLPPAQRAARRQDIQRAREQRVQQRQQATPNALAQPNAQVQRNAQRGPRRNGQPRIAAQAARQGRFAAAFAQPAASTQQRQARRHRWSAREAWRHHARAPFIAWYGPVFWPYAYSDVFDYTFWPDGYDDGYWAYAYDDFVDGLFWGEVGPPAEYAYAPPPSGASSAPAPVRYAAVQELCKQPGSGITAWPIAEIEKKVGLNDEQKQLLADMRRDAQTAAGAFKASCPAENAFPMTPPGRLAAMTARLQSTLDAVDTVKPALDKFYNSLVGRAEGALQRDRPEADDRRRDRAGLCRRRAELQAAQARPGQPADREDRGHGQADRRAGGRSGEIAGRHRQGGRPPAGGLSGRDADHAARPARRNGDAAEGDDRRRQYREAGARQLLRLAVERAEGALQPHGPRPRGGERLRQPFTAEPRRERPFGAALFPCRHASRQCDAGLDTACRAPPA